MDNYSLVYFLKVVIIPVCYQNRACLLNRKILTKIVNCFLLNQSVFRILVNSIKS